MIFYVRSLPVRALVNWMNQPLPPGREVNWSETQTEFFRRRHLVTQILTRRLGEARARKYERLSPFARCLQFLQRATPTAGERMRSAARRARVPRPLTTTQPELF